MVESTRQWKYIGYRRSINELVLIQTHVLKYQRLFDEVNFSCQGRLTQEHHTCLTSQLIILFQINSH